MEKLNLVIIDDEKTQIESYRGVIEDYNLKLSDENRDLEITVKDFKNSDSVMEYFMKERVDAIILDLQWTKGEEELEGADFLESLKKAYRIPVIVVSGYVNKISDEKESDLFKKYSTDDSFKDVLDYIVKIYDSGYTKAFGYKGLLEEKIVQTFWSFVNSNLSYWQNLNSINKEKRLLRYFLSRLIDTMQINEDFLDDNYHMTEYYSYPPYNENIVSGDIVEYNKELYIVITPPCDISNDKNSYIHLLGIDSINKIIEEYWKRKESKREDYIKKVIRNNNGVRYHFLPPLDDVFEGGMIDFQNILALEKTKNPSDEEKLIKILTIVPNVFKDIQSRYSYATGRAGQPEIDLEEIKSFFDKKKS